MKISFNKVLLSIPLYQLTFLTSFPYEDIFYEHIVKSIPRSKQETPTLILIETKEGCQTLNHQDMANQLIQDSNLRAIVICNEAKKPIQPDILMLYEQCEIPIVQIDAPGTIDYFLQEPQVGFAYSQLSLELDGFYKRGFVEIATNLAMAFGTPLLFLDEDHQLLWHTGPDREVKRCREWFQSFVNERGRSVQGEGTNQSKASSHKQDSFEIYNINIAGQVQLSLVASADLAVWQKKIMDKFVGFTAVLFQTDEVVRAQNERFKEFFIYELLYRKFESKKSLIEQGKTWGWNLEKPHHLLVLDVDSSSDELMDNPNILEEMVFHLETNKAAKALPIIILPFQEHIIVLIEDEHEGANIAINIAHWIEEEIAANFPHYSLYIGIGKYYKDTIDLNKSYQEAKIAIQFGKEWYEHKRVFHMNELGVLRLLSTIHRDLLQDFCQEELSPLIRSDEEDGTDYLKTLRMYFQYHGVMNDVAEALFIHPNTLRKRLNKLEKMIGVDRQNLEQLLTLMVAIKIYYSFSL